MKIQGKVSHVTPIEFVGQNQLEKRSVRIVMSVSDDGKYEQSIVFDLLKDVANSISEDNVGQTITAHLNFSSNTPETNDRGRMWNNIRAWKIELEDAVDTSVEEDLPF